MLYPLKFQPIFKHRIWGGVKLQSHLNKTVSSDETIGESWELSTLDGDESVIVNGEFAGDTLNELLEVYMEDLVGEKVFAKYEFDFPLLFKFIDASEKLSIQVHLGDEMAMERHGNLGKTEMWYVIHAEPDAEMILGFNQEINKETYLQHLEAGTLESVLQKVKVKAGDVYFVPAGLIHAIGKGILVAEIQESSDITYRIYDYNRKDKDGNLRELHTEQALDVIDFEHNFSSKIEPNGNELLRSDYFNVNKITVSDTLERDYSELDSFVVLMCLSGKATLNNVSVTKGETVFIPAVLGKIAIQAEENTEFLEVWVG